jgi:hypothetical protein
MARFSRALVLSIFACVGNFAATPSAQSSAGAIRGAIIDSSGGALPGVTVVAALPDGPVLATALTDGTGTYELSGLPAGEVRVTFQLDGFVTAAESVALQPGTVSTIQTRLELAHVTETVVVVGEASVVSPARSLPPPLPAIVPVPAHDRESVCGPAKAAATPESLGTIKSGRIEAKRDLYTKDDELIIDGGRIDGLEPGQNLVVRRHFLTTDSTGAAIKGEHTAGLLQIVVADERVSTGVVVYACDELRRGDFLAPFKPEPARTPDRVGIPAFNDAARILFADAGQMLGAPGRLMVIDRGSEQGIHAGQRVTLFRRRRQNAAKPWVVGDAVVVAVRGDSATIRVLGVSDIVSSGDWAAPQRQSPVATSAPN